MPASSISRNLKSVDIVEPTASSRCANPGQPQTGRSSSNMPVFSCARTLDLVDVIEPTRAKR
eukprot:246945-Lingulodinium_polyedra.AAC.1